MELKNNFENFFLKKECGKKWNQFYCILQGVMCFFFLVTESRTSVSESKGHYMDTLARLKTWYEISKEISDE